MPRMQVALAQLNERFSPKRIEDIRVELLDPGAKLSDVLRGLDVTTPGVLEFVDRWPPALQAGIIAVARNAVERKMPVTFAWAPGYDFEMSVWDVENTEQSHGGITMLLKCRYPDDRHPLDH